MESRSDLEKKIMDLERENEELRNLLNLNSVEDSEEDENVETESDIDNQDVKRIITNLLHEMQVPVHLKGYLYIREALLLSISDWEYLELVTKKLYPTIAKKYATTSSRTERAIRHAIEASWERGGRKKFIKMFGWPETSWNKPTNSEFLSSLTDWYNTNVTKR